MESWLHVLRLKSDGKILKTQLSYLALKMRRSDNRKLSPGYVSTLYCDKVEFSSQLVWQLLLSRSHEVRSIEITHNIDVIEEKLLCSNRVMNSLEINPKKYFKWADNVLYFICVITSSTLVHSRKRLHDILSCCSKWKNMQIKAYRAEWYWDIYTT